MFIPIKFKGMVVDVQIDKNDQICDFIFPETEPPSKVLSSYKEEKLNYDKQVMRIKTLRSRLLDKYRGRPYKLVINNISYGEETD